MSEPARLSPSLEPSQEFLSARGRAMLLQIPGSSTLGALRRLSDGRSSIPNLTDPPQPRGRGNCALYRTDEQGVLRAGRGAPSAGALGHLLKRNDRRRQSPDLPVLRPPPLDSPAPGRHKTCSRNRAGVSCCPTP